MFSVPQLYKRYYPKNVNNRGKIGRKKLPFSVGGVPCDPLPPSPRHPLWLPPLLCKPITRAQTMCHTIYLMIVMMSILTIVMMKVMMKNNFGAALISLPSAYILAQLYHGNGCLETLSQSGGPSDWETW